MSDVAPTSAFPPWIELPRDVTANILIRLGAAEILESAQKVCTTWWSVCKDPHMWRVIDLNQSDDPWTGDPDSDDPRSDVPKQLELEGMCRIAVDRSQGQLVVLNIEDFGSDELLRYISERSSQLKRLRLALCPTITGRGVSKAVKNFPQLRELHLFFIPMFGPEIEAIGRACPLLKAFNLNNSFYSLQCPLLLQESNEQASAVANTMPGLRHLCLFRNTMTIEGLEAILVGCPQLESLDIRQCFDMYRAEETGYLGRRCARQIRELIGPTGSVVAYEFRDDYMFDAGFSDLEYLYDEEDNYDDNGYGSE